MKKERKQHNDENCYWQLANEQKKNNEKEKEKRVKRNEGKRGKNEWYEKRMNDWKKK